MAAENTKLVEMKLPLHWLLSTAGAIVLALAGMYFSINQLREDVADLKITVKSGNAQTATVTGELAILRFRVETLEAGKKHATK